MCGMRVKLTWTFSVSGTCAPLFITVSGLNDREMPPGKDLIVLKIPGLCKSAELAAFIYAHDPEVKLKNQIPKNMGKLEDAKAALENGVGLENNRIHNNAETNRTY